MHTRGRINVRQLAILTKPGVYSDGGGLYLRVRKAGSRSWFFICMTDGKRRELGLGSVHDVTLAQARQKAAEMRAAFMDGRDPVLERSAAAQPAVMPQTFGEFAEALIDDIESGFRNEKHRKQWRSTLATHAASLRSKPLAAIDTDDIVEVLKPIWTKLPETASRVRGRIERVLDAAKAKRFRSGENPARWRGHLELLLPRRSKIDKDHHAALSFADVAGFMSELAGRSATAARALEFTILTAARTGEALGATWDEIDFETKIWSIPAVRMKAGQPHQIPLSCGAIAALEAVCPKKTDLSGLVFRNGESARLSNMSMSMLLRRMGRDSITVHGFRSTFRDWADEATSFAREDIEMALAHTIKSKAERAYRRGRAPDKRRALMAAWSKFCAG
ncbi:MAG: integrase arm-type DNA-binding domain-containing protein [Pseudomonadota bacterium]